MREKSFFGQETKFHHIGLAVKDLNLLVDASEIVEDKIQRVKVAFLKADGLDIELISPLCDDSPVSASIENGIKLLHICYTTLNLEDALTEGRRNGFHLLAKPVEAAAFSGKIAWLFHPVYGLFELLESESEENGL